MPAAKTAQKRPNMSLERFMALLAKMTPEPMPRREIKAPVLPPGVVPDQRPDPLPGEAPFMALDSQQIAPLYTYANQQLCGLGFPGYPFLAELAQRSEYRAPTETTGKEMTRRWIELKSKGGGKEKDEKIRQITDACDEFGIKKLFRQMAYNDGYYGRSQLYIHIKGQDTDLARQTPLVVDKACIRKGSLIGFKAIEPIWTTPYSYNSTDPTRADFFKPQSWFVVGRKTHATRLLTFISREVPDILKPAYNFGGLSMSQLMEPYVNQWFTTRDSVSRLIHTFSLSGVMTDLQSTLQGDGGDDLLKRLELFNRTRDIRGLMVLDKSTEEFFQFNTPLSSLPELQAQAQEHMAAPSHTPLVKLLGITPTGLNANSEGEIQVYYDYIHSEQEALFREHLTTTLHIIQLHLFGDIDTDIVFDFVPLSEPDGKELSDIRTADATAGQGYIDRGVIDADEERTRLINDPNSGYSFLTGEAPGAPDLDDGDGPNDLTDDDDEE